MSTELLYTAGDSSYLKVVLLSEILGTPLHSKIEGGELQLSLPDGTSITSANEICRYLCSEAGQKAFCLEGTADQALADQWLSWEATKLQPSVIAFLKSGTPSEQLHGCLKRLEDDLSLPNTKYLIPSSTSLSLVDVAVWAVLYLLMAPENSSEITEALHSGYPNVSTWFKTFLKESSFRSAISKASNDAGYTAYYQFAITGAKVEQAQIPPTELKAAKRAWMQGSASVPTPIKREHPILPIQGERNILITSALPYVNNVPHLGNIIGCVLSGDVFARYCRLRNYNTLYICGTDEYGTATETKALEEGLTPKEICEKYFAVHSEIYEWFNILFDFFGRTSTPQQTQIAQDIFSRLNERGYIMKDTVDQLHCGQCNMFLADRFVEGICPICAYPDARGDQCDKCGRLINATELKSPRCKVCSSNPQIVTSNHLFLDLCKLEPIVKEWSKKSSNEGMWAKNAQQITTSWLRDGLKPRCITRDLKWGTPVPLEGYENKVFYVWFDAPIGYLSITACYTDQWEKWWKNPQQVENFQFMAKDNVPFHTVVFPCSLLGSEDNYTLLNNISSTEYLNYEDGKFSKSRGVGVFGTDAQETGIPADVYRFYLLYVRPETQDSVFSWSDFVLKNNTELLNNLGNFINRVLTFIANNFDSTIQEMNLIEEDVEFIAKVTRELQSYLGCLEKVGIRDGLKHILNISRLGNAYIQTHKPWSLVKQGPEKCARAGSLLGVCANVVCLLSVMMQPYMPEVSRQVQDQLQAPEECNILVETFVPFLQPGHRTGKPSVLFSKIEESTASKLKQRFSGKQVPQ